MACKMERHNQELSYKSILNTSTDNHGSISNYDEVMKAGLIAFSEHDAENFNRILDSIATSEKEG